jgi:hypothetical protein
MQREQSLIEGTNQSKRENKTVEYVEQEYKDHGIKT